MNLLLWTRLATAECYLLGYQMIRERLEMTRSVCMLFVYWKNAVSTPHGESITWPRSRANSWDGNPELNIRGICQHSRVCGLNPIGFLIAQYLHALLIHPQATAKSLLRYEPVIKHHPNVIQLIGIRFNV